jgi:hypothetical protein
MQVELNFSRLAGLLPLARGKRAGQPRFRASRSLVSGPSADALSSPPRELRNCGDEIALAHQLPFFVSRPIPNLPQHIQSSRTIELGIEDRTRMPTHSSFLPFCLPFPSLPTCLQGKTRMALFAPPPPHG